jgi:cytochrome c oxidase subunit III
MNVPSAPIAGPNAESPADYAEQLRLKNARLGLLLWRIANGLVFIFFGFANSLMRNVQTSWPPPGVERLPVALPLIITLALLLSSITAARALNAIRADSPKTMRASLLISMALGLFFFVGIVVVSLQIPYSGPYSSIILSMNFFHGLHVFIGLLLLGYVFVRSRRNEDRWYRRANHWTVEAAVVFWHFVDLMWLFFFAVIYIL